MCFREKTIDEKDYITNYDLERIYSEIDLVNKYKTGGCSALESLKRKLRSYGMEEQYLKLVSGDPLYVEELRRQDEFLQETLPFLEEIKNKYFLIDRQYYFDETLGETVHEHAGNK